MTTRRSRLLGARRERLLVKFTRSLQPGAEYGYVMAVGPRFFLLALVDDGARFNGFRCFRISDVREFEAPHRYWRFVEAALKKRGERRPTRPPVTLGNMGTLLGSANRAFPLVTIHRERADAAVCHIGRIVDVSKGRVSLLEIDPGAVWEKTPTTYRLSEITRVDFGGLYEEALNLVGGQPRGV